MRSTSDVFKSLHKMEASSLDQLQIDSFEALEQAERLPCPQCKVMRRYYCCECIRTVGISHVPTVELPYRCTIVLCNRESRKKSSIIPMPLIAANSEIIVADPENVPMFPPDSVLVFPGPDARSLEELSDAELCSLANAVFIDSTWRQTRQMLKSRRLSDLPKLKLSTHTTIFWRHQQEAPTCLATVEAIYYFFTDFLKEKHRRGLGPAYAGELDNLLWFFMHTYKTIQAEYSEKRHKNKTFRYIPGYIKP